MALVRCNQIAGHLFCNMCSNAHSENGTQYNDVQCNHAMYQAYHHVQYQVYVQMLHTCSYWVETQHWNPSVIAWFVLGIAVVQILIIHGRISPSQKYACIQYISSLYIFIYIIYLFSHF